MLSVVEASWQSANGHEALPDFFGTKGAAAVWRDSLFEPFNWLAVALLVGYGLRMLADYRRYARYLDDNFSDPERLRFAGLRQFLVLQGLALALGLVGAVLSYLFDLSYDAAWYIFALRGVLIYGLIVVGIQANYAAASPLRFDPDAAPAASAGVFKDLEELKDLETSIETLEAPSKVLDTLGMTLEAPAKTLGSANSAPVAHFDASEAATNIPKTPAGLPAELLPWRTRLLALMVDEQPWLEPELTLTELAQRLRTNPGLLSKVINAGCGQNFNDFVNTYRVHEAQRKLADPRFGHYSLVGVALESGFNSKSTFNRVFKKLLGQALSEVARPKS
ncbi:MAG: helix-turn-helix domain-containing protein [Janthinobacterium lividum]